MPAKPLSLLLISFVLVALLAAPVAAQVSSIIIPAGTPEDQELQRITGEAESDKRIEMFKAFVEKFAGNPAAVAYGNWQLAQLYVSEGNLQQGLDTGDKALAAAPSNLEILASQAQTAQQLKLNSKVIEYAIKGGEAFNGIGKTRPEGMSDERFASEAETAKQAAKPSYEYLETAALNAFAAVDNPKTRFAYVEKFDKAFPNSRFAEQIAQYAMFSLQEMRESARAIAYGERLLAKNPESLATLVLLAGLYAEDQKVGNPLKAMTYSKRVLTLANADSADADESRKLSAGVAYSTMGYALLRQEKAVAAIPELKRGAALLKQDPAAYSTVLYRLGYAYAKLNRRAEAREVLKEAVTVEGPFQQACRDLLATVNAGPKK
jgi:tetratricopeptide (TPR) repeat protein